MHYMELDLKPDWSNYDYVEVRIDGREMGGDAFLAAGFFDMDKSIVRVDSSTIGEFSQRVTFGTSQIQIRLAVGTLLWGVNVDISSSSRLLKTAISIPAVDNALLAYRVRVQAAPCEGELCSSLWDLGYLPTLLPG